MYRISILLIVVLISIESISQTSPNLGFEYNNFTGWIKYKDSIINPGSTTYNTYPLTGINTTYQNLFVSTYKVAGTGPDIGYINTTSAIQNVDPYGNYPVVCNLPGAGKHSCKLGNDSLYSTASGIRYNLKIPADKNKYKIVFYYAVNFEDPGPGTHELWEMPFFRVSAFDSANSSNSVGALPLVLNKYDISFISNLHKSATLSYINGDSVFYTAWTPATMIVKNMGGKTLSLDCLSAGCSPAYAFYNSNQPATVTYPGSPGTHFCYSYLDFDTANIINYNTDTIRYCLKDSAFFYNPPPGYKGYIVFDSATSKILGADTNHAVSSVNSIMISGNNIPKPKTVMKVALIPYSWYGTADTLTYYIDTISCQPVSITSFNPKSAVAGNTVTISGTNLSSITSVSFGGVEASSFTIVNSTTITAVVGSGSSGNVSVISSGGTASLPGFTYLSPIINSFYPAIASVGTTVTITGTGFTGTTSVSFGGVAASSFTVVSSSVITAVVGTGVSGNVSVSNSWGTASLSGFTFVFPTITSINPPNGVTGTSILITGSLFTGTTAVSFGGVAASSFTVIDSSHITAIVGTGATGDVSVTTSLGTVSFSGFIYQTVNVLDKAGLTIKTPATFACSFRLLSSNYTGPLARIYDGNKYYDVYPDSLNHIFSNNSKISAGYNTYDTLVTGKTNKLLNSLDSGKATATVAIWYDQSGNGYNAVQANPSSQPAIISLSNILSINNLPSTGFNGSNTYLSALLPTAAGTAAHTLNTVAAGMSGNIVALSSTTSIADQNSCVGVGTAYQGTITEGAWYGGFGEDANYLAGVYTSDLTVRSKKYDGINTITGFLNGANIFSNTSTIYNLTSADILLGIQDYSPDQPLNGSISEIVVFVSSLPDSSRQTLENNQQDFYSINNKTITGNIHTPLGKIIGVYNPVTITATDSSTISSNSDSSGNYKFSLKTGNYTLHVYKNNDINKTNGITTLDLALTQAHILGKNLFNSPYKIIAADVNADSKVTALDIVYMKRLILGIDTTYTNSSTTQKRLWVFIDSAYKFTDSSNPFPFKDSISFSGLNTNMTNQTFIGCKLGDVNWDWNPAVARPQVNNVNAVELSYNSIKANNSGQIIIPVMVKNFKEMLGMQFTISFDAGNLQWQGMGNNPLGIETGTNHSAEGSISFLWVDPKNEIKTMEDGSVIMELVFRKIDNGQLIIDNGKPLNLNGDITAIAAYDKDYNLHNIVLNSSTINISEMSKDTWTVAPNPANDGIIHVQMNLHENKNIVFRLLDNIGKVLIVKEVEGIKGGNNFTLYQQNKLPEGVYYLQANRVNGGEVKKIKLVN